MFPFDDRANPSKHKMWVCVSRADLWFLRINSQKYTELCAPLSNALYPRFLAHDSFIGCGGDLITVTDAELELLLGRQMNPSRQGIVGAIHASDREAVCAAVRASPKLSPARVRVIVQELGCLP